DERQRAGEEPAAPGSSPGPPLPSLFPVPLPFSLAPLRYCSSRLIPATHHCQLAATSPVRQPQQLSGFGNSIHQISSLPFRLASQIEIKRCCSAETTSSSPRSNTMT